MLVPSVPDNEGARLRALVGLAVLDTPAEERFDRITRLAARLFGAPIALISLIDADRQWFKSAQGLAATETPREISFCGHAILDAHAFVVEDASKDQRFADNPLVTGQPDIRFYAGQRIHAADGMPIGTLCVIDQQPRTFADADLQALRDLAALAESELQRQILSDAHERWIVERDDLLRRASVEGLTRTWNRTAIMELLDVGLARAARGTPLGVAMIDVDHFKSVNDENGHLAGDCVLAEVAARIRAALRESDTVGRYGGDEFLVVLGDCSNDAAFDVCERVRELVTAKPIATPAGPVQVTVSIGASRYTPQRTTAEALVAAADDALYRAKRAGRNCVATAPNA